MALWNTKPSQTLLFIDDQKYMHELVGYAARDAGCDFTAVTCVDQALKAFEATPFNFVITDIGLGDENGLEVVKWLRKSKAGKGIPIIVLSQYNDAEHLEGARECGADDYILKPFTMERVKKSITRWQSLSEHEIDWSALSPEQARLTRLTLSTIGFTFSSVRNGGDVPYQLLRDNCLSILQAGQDNEIVGALSALKDHSIKTYLHCVRFSAYLGMMAASQGAVESEFLDIVTSGLLHDIGMVKVPAELLEKEHWSAEEARLVNKSHVLAAAGLMEDQKEPISECARQVMTLHHERIDGSGPLRKKGHELPDVVRMAVVIETYLSLRDGLHTGGYRTNQPFAEMELDDGLDQRFVDLLKQTQKVA
ncbi:MAG: response regulator [Rhodospirillaceae bacterium]